MARALVAAVAVSLLAVSDASGVGAQTPQRGGTLAFRMISAEPACLNVLDVRCQGTPLPEPHRSRDRAGSASGRLRDDPQRPQRVAADEGAVWVTVHAAEAGQEGEDG